MLHRRLWIRPPGENILDAADLGRAREHACSGVALVARAAVLRPLGQPVIIGGDSEHHGPRRRLLGIIGECGISSARMRQCAPLLIVSNGARALSLFIFLPLSFLEQDNVTSRQMADQRLASCLS